MRHAIAATAVAALLGAALPEALAQPARGAVGILPVAGDARLSRELDAALGRAVAVAGRGQRDVIGPTEVRTRLAARTTEAVARADEQIARAEQAGARMNRDEAVAAARRAVSELQAAGGRFVAPQLMARAQVALAVALLLEPADSGGASGAFRAAFVADPGYRPDEERFSPRILRLMEGARARPLPAKPPGKQQLVRLAQLCGLSQLVWIAVASDKEVIHATARRYSSKGEQQRAVARRRLDRGSAVDQAAALVIELLGPSEPAVSSPAEHADAEKPARPLPAPPTARRWYRRWWVWTLIGAVMVGAGVSLGIALSGSEEQSVSPRPGFDVRFNLP